MIVSEFVNNPLFLFLSQKESPKELATKFNAANIEPIDGFDISRQVITDLPNKDLYLLSKIMKVSIKKYLLIILKIRAN